MQSKPIVQAGVSNIVQFFLLVFLWSNVVVDGGGNGQNIYQKAGGV